MQHPKKGQMSIHLVNHLFLQDSMMVERKNFNIKLRLDSLPLKVYRVSPDYGDKKSLVFKMENGTLEVEVDKLRYYDIILIDYGFSNQKKKQHKNN